MSVVVMGMEMPSGCQLCDFSDDETRFCKAAKEYIPMLGKSEFCPLVELPEKHGRLGDLDEVKTAFPCGESVRTECVRATIDNMPTIVEAEGE